MTEGESGHDGGVNGATRIRLLSCPTFLIGHPEVFSQSGPHEGRDRRKTLDSR